MPNRNSTSEYANRMHRVLEHIDRHLDEQLELEALASVANFSSFHFHRLFTAWMGRPLSARSASRSVLSDRTRASCVSFI
jgi:AraC family transcriptional regulator